MGGLFTKTHDNKTDKRKKKLYERIAEFCEIPEQAVADIPVFMLRGHHELEIVGCSGILEYDSSRVVLSVGNDFFTIIGDSLELTDFSEKRLYVRGNISLTAFGRFSEGDGGEWKNV